MTPEDMARMKDMVRDLNQMLQDKMQGGEPDFDPFMQQYGDLFGDNPPQTLDELIEQMQRQMSQMQNLLDSLPARHAPAAAGPAHGQDRRPGAAATSCRSCSRTSSSSTRMRDLRNQYPFRGDEEIDLNEAMQLMDEHAGHGRARAPARAHPVRRRHRRHRRREAARAARATKPRRRWTSSSSSSRSSRRPATSARSGNNWELTPRGTRKIGQKALGEIYSQLKKEQSGKHKVARPGPRRRAQRRHQAVRVRRPVPPAPREDDHERPAPRRRRSCRCGSTRTTSRSGPLGAAHPDRDRDDGRPLVVDGAARQLPGGEEGRAGAAEPDQHPVRARHALHHRLLRLRARAQGGAAALRALGRVRARHEHAPRADAGAEPAGQAQDAARARSS